MWSKTYKNSDKVLDARDPNGCRCPQLESQCLSNGKKIILVLNKVDLVPKQIVKSWLEGFFTFIREFF